MDTVTYLDQQVQNYIGEHFATVKFNLAEPETITEAVREFRPFWTPTLIFLDHHRIEVRRILGFRSPAEFLPELTMARANAAMIHGKYAEAFTLYESVFEEHPDSAVAPEALYFSGAAALRRDDNPDGLIAQWRQLKQRYPDSIWWASASFIEQTSENAKG